MVGQGVAVVEWSRENRKSSPRWSGLGMVRPPLRGLVSLVEAWFGRPGVSGRGWSRLGKLRPPWR